MNSELLQRSSVFARRLRLQTLLRIRWFGLFFQLVTVLFVSFFMGFPMPLLETLMLMAISVMINVFLIFYYPKNHR